MVTLPRDKAMRVMCNFFRFPQFFNRISLVSMIDRIWHFNKTIKRILQGHKIFLLALNLEQQFLKKGMGLKLTQRYVVPILEKSIKIFLSFLLSQGFENRATANINFIFNARHFD